jgi:hypothetical protein
MKEYWYEVKDGDPRAVALYRRHYSCRGTNHGQKIDYVRFGISGQGESMILLTQDCQALFGWKYEAYRDDGQAGINCFVFRRESGELSSVLIKEANELAWAKWGKQRLFTFIDSKKTKHKRDPGRCFIKAGYKKCGYSKKGLVILECLPVLVDSK